MKWLTPVLLLIVLFGVSACNLGVGGAASCSNGDGKVVTTASQVKYEDLTVCNGAEAKQGNTVKVNYISSVKDGSNLRQIQSTYPPNTPVSFKVGAGQVIRGLEDGVVGMKVGSKRRLTLMPDLHYGAAGDPSKGVPMNATLVYDVELVDVQP